jgi:type VI protein secretion system component VasK
MFVGWAFGLFIALIVAILAYFGSKKFRRWLGWILLGALIVGLVYLCEFYLRQKYPAVGSNLPVFSGDVWSWFLFFILLAFGMAYWVGRMLLVPRSAAVAAPAKAEEQADPRAELDAAWEEIVVRMEQAQIELRKQRFYLLLSPDEGWSAALVRSANLNLFVQAPETVAPIHAYATAEGVLLSCAGASSLGRQDASGIDLIEHLGRKLLALAPEAPVVRGIAVLLPADWAAQPDAPNLSAAARDDLQAIQRVLKVRCPTFVLFPQMETTTGFNEFVARMPETMRQNRCGFAVPSTQDFSGDLLARGFIWLSGWFHTWILNQMSNHLVDQGGNNRLFCLDDDVRRYRRPWRAVVESALSTHRDTEPVLFRGAYCMATGSERAEQAFSAGLLRGPRSRIIADHVMTTWTADAAREDHFYRRVAWAVAAVGGALNLITWGYIVTSYNVPWWWLGLLAIFIAWLIFFLRHGLRA